MKPPKQLSLFFLGILFLFIIVYFSRPIDLTSADLGRHLKNGEIILNSLSVSKINLYSYVEPTFGFINHHWGSGVIFFLVHKISGFEGLSALLIVLSLLTFYFFYDVARKYSDPKLAALVALLILPLVASRTEIRPEHFSYFFAGIFFWILWRYRENGSKLIFLLPVFELLWVNIHIYFIFGWFFIGAFLLEAIIFFYWKKEQKFYEQAKVLTLVLSASILVAIINPNGWRGVIAPLNIFNNYGYMVFENQPIWGILKLFWYPPVVWFALSAVLLLASWIISILKVRRSQDQFLIANFIISIVMLMLALFMVRNFSFFGFFVLPLVCLNLRSVVGENLDLQTFAPLFFILAFFINPFWQNSNISWGLESGTTEAAQFYLAQNIQGPVFNNYDIGGYLIYYLYPQQRVFVDNRPEAYSKDFLQKTYVRMQEDEGFWKEEEEKYNFNSIFFNRLDQTPWAQPFLIKRLSDPFWVPVYVDSRILIMLKRNSQNAPIIKQYELPKSMFSTSGS